MFTYYAPMKRQLLAWRLLPPPMAGAGGRAVELINAGWNCDRPVKCCGHALPRTRVGTTDPGHQCRSFRDRVPGREGSHIRRSRSEVERQIPTSNFQLPPIWALVVGRWSLVIGHWSLVVGRWELTTYNPGMLRPFRGITPRVHETAIVAAGTLVTEESRIPARSLAVGSPGQVKRPLTDAEAAFSLEYSERYVGYRLDYLQA